MSKLEGNTFIKASAITEQKQINGQPFPLVVTPTETASALTFPEWSAWFHDNVSFLRDLLLQYGVVLFRDFPVETPEHFDKFVKLFGYEPFPYVGGAAPRRVVCGNVFTSNEAPPSELIPFHHEMAQSPDYPKVLYFYCDVAPPEGGATPLVLSNAAYVTMATKEPEFVRRLEAEGVCYTRVLPEGDDPTSPIGRGWQSTYLTQDKAEAEARATAQGTRFEWLPDGCMKTTTAVLPGVRVDQRTGKKTWFNSIIAAYKGWKDCRNDPLRAVTFPNGDAMPRNAMETLERVLDDLAVSFRWKKADVVWVDNRTALHGRQSFTPPRRILACLCREAA